MEKKKQIMEGSRDNGFRNHLDITQHINAF